MKTVIAAALVALLGALCWGFYAGSRPAPPRAQDLVAPVSHDWRETLPRDPQLAAQAYLARVPAEMRERGEAVSRTRYWVWGARIALTLGAAALFLFSGAAGALAGATARLTRLAWLQAALFTIALFAWLEFVFMPIDVYAGYVRPRTFGFADRPFSSWLGDHVLQWALLSTFYAAAIAAVTTLMRRKPHAWAGWSALALFALTSVYALAAPNFIEPLFNTYAPLPDSSIKSDILNMAHANGVPAGDVYTADASRQTRLLNAHVSGLLGTTRITLDDTTLSEQDRPMILATMGHEIGHYAMGHVFVSIALASAATAFGFMVIGWAGPLLVRRFGARWRIGALHETGGVAVFWLLFLIGGFATTPLANAYSRWQETQADLYGLNASQSPHGMAEFMIHDADTARLSPTPLDVFLFYTHPSRKSRIETAMRWRAAHMPASGGSPEARESKSESLN
jgi:STE24 endopeptidase